jgi:hypothetical protein
MMVDRIAGGFYKLTFQARSLLSPRGGLRLSSTARVERGSSNSLPISQEEWPRLPFTARIGRAPFHRARSASKKGTWPLLPAPLMGNTLQTLGSVRLCSTMEQTRPYHRSLYRLPVSYPAMYCVMSTVGEGTITNLSAVGCTIEADQPLLADQNVALRLLLPDQQESLPIDEAQVRWVHGNLAGIEFVQVEPTANLRLHGFVWDQMVQRVHTIQQHRAMS